MHILKKHQLLAKIEYNYRIEKIQLNYLCKWQHKVSLPFYASRRHMLPLFSAILYKSAPHKTSGFIYVKLVIVSV